FQNFLEREYPRLAVDQSQEDDGKTVLQGCELVELIEHDVGIGVASEFQHQTHRVVQVAFVANARDAGNFVLVYGLGDAFFNAVAGLLIGNLADDDAVPPLGGLSNSCTGANHDRAAAGVVAAANAAAPANDAAGGEVGAGADFQQLVDR